MFFSRIDDMIIYSSALTFRLRGNTMGNGVFRILIFLIVALLIAFLVLKQMQNPTSLSDRISQTVSDIAADAAQSAVNVINEAAQNTDLMENLQTILGGMQ